MHVTKMPRVQWRRHRLLFGQIRLKRPLQSAIRVVMYRVGAFTDTWLLVSPGGWCWLVETRVLCTVRSG